MTSQRWAMSNQRWNNVVVNVEIYNAESTLSISTVILATLDNVETILLLSTSSFAKLINVETTLWIWPFSKDEKNKKIFLSFKKKKTHLINNTCFRLWSIKMKAKYGTYDVKINVGKYNAWYMKRIWKLQYEFADGKTSWCNSTARPYLYLIALLRINIVKKQHIFLLLYSLSPFFYIVF